MRSEKGKEDCYQCFDCLIIIIFLLPFQLYIMFTNNSNEELMCNFWREFMFTFIRVANLNNIYCQLQCFDMLAYNTNMG